VNGLVAAAGFIWAFSSSTKLAASLSSFLLYAGRPSVQADKYGRTAGDERDFDHFMESLRRQTANCAFAVSAE